MKSNKELGIKTLTAKISPIIQEIVKTGEADITNASREDKLRLHQLCRHTTSLCYAKRVVIKAQKPIKILSQNDKHIKIQETIDNTRT